MSNGGVLRLDPPRPIPAAGGTLIIDEDGDWAVTDERAGADGFFADDAGELVIDDSAGSRKPVFLGSTLMVI